VRDSWADESERVTDIHFDEAVGDPIGQVSRVYDAVGLPLTGTAVTAMTDWLADRPREVARPSYDLSTYGLADVQVDERFALYNKRFRKDKQ
jgi:hypothetical protein